MHQSEKDVKELFDTHFPEYWSFRATYLKPLVGISGSWRNDTFEPLELIGMAAVGVVKSIRFINYAKREIVHADEQQRFKNIYFHFGMVLDCIQSMARNISRTLDHLDIKKLNIPAMDKDSLNKKFEKWHKTYPKAITKLIKTGSSIVFQPQPVDFVLDLISNKDIRNEYCQLRPKITAYRNCFIHNPTTDIIRSFGDEFKAKYYVVKRDYVNVARSWSDLEILIQNKPEMFVDPKEQVDNDLNELLPFLNRLWIEFGIIMFEITTHKDYPSILHGVDRKVK